MSANTSYLFAELLAHDVDSFLFLPYLKYYNWFFFIDIYIDMIFFPLKESYMAHRTRSCCRSRLLGVFKTRIDTVLYTLLISGKMMNLDWQNSLFF